MSHLENVQTEIYLNYGIGSYESLVPDFVRGNQLMMSYLTRDVYFFGRQIPYHYP